MANTETKQPAKWPEIESSPDYQGLDSAGQQQLKQRYWDNVVTKSPDVVGLQSPEQEQLKAKFFGQEPSPQLPERQMPNIDLLGGRLPMSDEEFQKLERTVDMLSGKQVPASKSVMYVNNPRKLYAEETQRRKIYQNLLEQGGDTEQIKSYLDIKKKMQAFPLGRAIGATVGSIGLPALINLIPGAAALPEEAVTVPLGRKVGQFLGGTVGAGLGGAAGETGQIALEENRLASRQEIVDAALVEMGTEAGMRGLGAAGKSVLSNLIKKEAPEAARTIEAFAKVGGTYTPSQMDRRLLVRAGEEVARGAFGAKEIFDEIAERNVSAVKIFSDQILDSLAQGVGRKSSIELGQIFAEGITRPKGRIMTMVDDLFDPLYKEVDELTKAKRVPLMGEKTALTGLVDASGQPITRVAPAVIGETIEGVGVSTKNFKKYAVNLLRQNQEIQKEGSTKAILLTSEGKGFLEDILSLKTDITYSEARSLRSRLLRDVRKLHRDLNQDEAIIAKMSQLIDDAVFDPATAKNLTPEAKNLLQNTNRLYRSTKEALEQTFPEKLVKQLQNKPSDVTRQIFKPKNPVAVKQLRQALIEPISGKPSEEGKILWNQLRTAWLSDVIETASKEGKLNYHTIDAALRNLGDDVLKEMYPGSDIKQVEMIRDTFRVLTRKPSSGASLFIRGSQVGGGIMMYDGVKKGDFAQVTAGGALVLGPYFYARMATNPTGRKLLTAGFKEGFTPGSKAYAPTVARLINLATKLDRLEQKAKTKKEAKESYQKTMVQSELKKYSY